MALLKEVWDDFVKEEMNDKQTSEEEASKSVKLVWMLGTFSLSSLNLRIVLDKNANVYTHTRTYIYLHAVIYNYVSTKHCVRTQIYVCAHTDTHAHIYVLLIVCTHTCSQTAGPSI